MAQKKEVSSKGGGAAAVALLRGTDSDMLSQRRCVGRGKHEEESSFLGLRHPQD